VTTTMADDPDGAAAHNWGVSSRDSNKCAIKHFNIFLKREVVKHQDVAKLLFGCDTQPDPDSVDYELLSIAKRAKIDIGVMNHFARYLAIDAINQKDPTKGLSYEGASRYLSSVRTRIERDLMNFKSKAPRQLTDPAMKPIRAGMANIFLERHMENHTSLSNSHATSEKDDLVRIITVCMWSGDWKTANLAFYILSLYQLAAEAASVRCYHFVGYPCTFQVSSVVSPAPTSLPR
jgi:hypothetical protein